MFVRILVALWISRQLLRQVFRRFPKRIAYTQRTHTRVFPNELDYPTLAVLHLARQFQSVVEIGAAGGGRIVTVKRELPDIAAVAMDVADDYKAVRVQDGVTFQIHDPKQFPFGALIFCVGTLNCMRIDELEAFFSTLAERGCSLLMFEPKLPFAHTKSYRRNLDCWYHPYRLIAQRHGYAESHAEHRTEWPHTGSLKNFEDWHPVLFRPVN